MVTDSLDDFARLAAACRLHPAATQQVFAALMHSSARPGRPEHLASITGVPPVLLPLLALCDLETSIAVCGDPDEATRWESIITAITGARRTAPADAAWIAVLDPTGWPEALGANRGSPEAPETAARLLVAVQDLQPSCDQLPSGPATTVGVTTVAVTGPGVDGTLTFCATGIVADVITALDAGNVFPCGLDVWLVDGSGCLVGLPRSCRVTAADERTV